ncbi:uncharacterized protein LOC109819295 [Cajanus cajan]|uniref:Uncharacterized protein n=1 Tax=Cajanus cajan TaxID=3821 RepID=A0A151RF81_CAJCA|nr:uncharacterized protein LOC109819295 [Cajanus cajan]KYP41045.1 hypothetical protein KK1_037568 [Cajanus cajan]
MEDSYPEVKTCICSPSIHPLAFRCSNHRSLSPKGERKPPLTPNHSSSNVSAGNVVLLKTAIRNSMLKKGGTKAEFAESMVIREKPLSQRLNRRKAFKIRPSPLSLVSNAHHL